MSRELEGKVGIVTGAATGIGKAIALAFGAADARVVVNHLDTPDLADALVAQISRDGGEALAVAADISRREAFEMLVQAAIDRFGSWDVLVNNAAVALVKPFGEVTEGEFEQSLQVNVKGTFNGCQLALERMADGGRIINISSSTTGLMLPGYGVYDATKGAIEAMTHVIAMEFGRRGITVNAVSPGATETESYRIGKSEEFLVSLEAMSAFGRLGRPEEIAAVVAFLASDRGHWITAQNVRVNGGTV
jgi:3-oxoacyl-[acyl-carrier protein] reductase